MIENCISTIQICFIFQTIRSFQKKIFARKNSYFKYIKKFFGKEKKKFQIKKFIYEKMKKKNCLINYFTRNI